MWTSRVSAGTDEVGRGAKGSAFFAPFIKNETKQSKVDGFGGQYSSHSWRKSIGFDRL
jgi:hypothetical protein